MKIKFIQDLIDILRKKKPISICIKKPKIKNYQETIETLLKTNKSIVRYGDGEIAIIKGLDVAEKKAEILKAEKAILMVGDTKTDAEAASLANISFQFRNCGFHNKDVICSNR